MSNAKVAISIDDRLLNKIDMMVKRSQFKNRSQAIQFAVRESVVRLEHRRLAEECAKLDKKFEIQMAEEGLFKDVEEWPEY